MSNLNRILLLGTGVFGIGGVGIWQAISTYSKHKTLMSSYRKTAKEVQNYVSVKGWNWIEVIDPESKWWGERWKYFLRITIICCLQKAERV